MFRFWLRFMAIFVLIASLAIPALMIPSSASAASCEFVLGFKTLHDLIPNVVGNCTENVHYNPWPDGNGDGLQQTTNGLLVWRRLDNFTAFTDGFHTWINGPYGLQERLNTQLFPWEQEVQNAVQFVRQQGFEVLSAANYNPPALLHVLTGFRVPTADAHEQYAFFFTTGGKYLGTDTSETSADLGVAAQTNDTVTISCVLYKPDDPMCCPTGGTANVRYFYNGTRLTPLDPIPSADWNAPFSRR